MNYTMTCLICGQTNTSLVGIQEHVMETHGYKQDDLREQTKREIEPGHYIFTFPDQKDWLEAKRNGGNTVALL